ncbi:MAG TPA: DUF3617 domain-containing protein [Allosphingosinicella sp.]|nr:DUF3617 domain-containing protein [Allosphingosinicella sp.]
MRALAFVPLLILAACSETDGGGPKQETKAAAATQLEPGQWETVAEVTRFTQMDKGKPAINTPAGSKATATACVGEAEARKPAPVLFTASEEGSCEYRDFYMSNGRINGSLACKRPGLGGEVMTSVEGTFTADSFEGTSLVETYLYTDGDVKIAAKISGRRVGACAA